ncbi:MAG: histidine phosphatase family protein [Halobacteriales archaeon SW_9_67_25]|nr:MAG: histidine phosphatase family protein [Halobacteriales archaeon SW_9_67_25]
MSADATVLLVRHGETAWNRENRVQGWAPVGLADSGREQARELGAHLASVYAIDRVVASDLRRARETAALLHEAGVPPTPTYTRRWRERDVGVYQGLSKEQLFGRYPEFRATTGVMGVRSRPAGGESLLDLRERVLAAWEDLLAGADPGETALVVTHSGPIYTLLGHLAGTDLPSAFVEHSQDNCALTEVHVPGDTSESGDWGAARIVRENERP